MAGATLMIAAGLVGAVAAPASAKPPFDLSNYGTCVSTEADHPRESGFGPRNSRGATASNFRGGGVMTGILHSGEKPPFVGDVQCPLV